MPCTHLRSIWNRIQTADVILIVSTQRVAFAFGNGGGTWLAPLVSVGFDFWLGAVDYYTLQINLSRALSLLPASSALDEKNGCSKAENHRRQQQ